MLNPLRPSICRTAPERRAVAASSGMPQRPSCAIAASTSGCTTRSTPHKVPSRSVTTTSIGTSTLDVSALATFTANVDTIRVGIGGGTNRTARGILLLAPDNNLTANTSIVVSQSSGPSSVGANSSITFGDATTRYWRGSN